MNGPYFSSSIFSKSRLLQQIQRWRQQLVNSLQQVGRRPRKDAFEYHSGGLQQLSLRYSTIELELINKAKTDKSLIDQAEQDDQVTATLWLRIT